MALLNSNSGIIPKGNPEIPFCFTNITLWYESVGGYCCLYKAQKMGKYHMLKTLKPEYEENPVYRGLLQKEFQISYPLSHPHVVQTLGMEEVAGVGVCIVMEYIDGVNLREYLHSKSFDKGIILKILSELLQAVSYIHSFQIIHRDLKPENIIITRNGFNVKLIDFGLSDTDSYFILKHPAGTLEYASPEQKMPEGAIDNRADIYSVGVILEEIVKTTRIKLPHADKIIERCKSEIPLRRYVSVDEISHLLHSRNKYLPYLAAFLVFSLVIGSSFLGYRWGMKQGSKRSMSVDFYNQIVEHARNIAEHQCQTLYGWYDLITSQDSLTLWINEYSSLVLKVNQEVDSILKQNISDKDLEFNIYKITLNKMVENIWMDYYYTNKDMFATPPRALILFDEQVNDEDFVENQN